MIADLPENTILYKIYKYKDITFIEINKMNSMVFNIYNNRIYDSIINWNINDNDVDNNTIDSYLKQQYNLKIIVPVPFEFSCLNINSTIWGDINLFNEYNKLFQKSLNIINNLIQEYLKTNEIINL